MLYNAVSRIGIATLQPLDTPFRMTVPTHIVTDVCMYVCIKVFSYFVFLLLHTYTHTPSLYFPSIVNEVQCIPPSSYAWRGIQWVGYLSIGCT